MSKYLVSRLAGMKPYVPGEQPQDRQFVKLNTNESPFPPAPGVIRALNGEEAARLNLYPDPDAREATKAIADYFSLQPENVILTNGSDEILFFCFHAFCDSNTPACFADITYGFYPVFARILCLPTRIFPLHGALDVHKEDYYHAGGTIFLANPNAPTGRALPLADLEDILKHNPQNVLVVDEAYVDFGAKSAAALIGQYDNLVVAQTMSKSRNLAGARLGYALANKELVQDLHQVRFSFNPYNVNRLSLIAARESIQDEAYFQKCTNEIQRVREYTANALTVRSFEVIPSCANFLFVKPPKLSGAAYYAALKERGVLVRHFAQERIKDYVRITIGTQEQMEALLAATDELLKQERKINECAQQP